MNQTAKVALVGCEGYEDEAVVQAAVRRGLALLGGAERFVRAGETIVVKPNLLSPDSPEKLVSPHPAVFKAVIQALQSAGARVTYGDSPGFGPPAFAAKRMGYTAIAREMGASLADFENAETVSFPEGRLVKQFDVARGVLAADGLVNLAKFKTHGLMRVTGAVKNLFGCIPGARKAGFHARMSDEAKFSQMLVDLACLLKPRLNVIDGIVAMQGNGPRNGDPFAMKALLFSDDPAAIDAVMCRMIQLDLKLTHLFRCAYESGLGNPYQVEILGDPLEDFIVSPQEFAANHNPMPTTIVSQFLKGFLSKHVVARPYILEEKCTRCDVCVNACPSTPRALDWHDGDKAKAPSYNYEDCIRCYCCQELCPSDAVQIETPPLGKLANRLKI